MDRLEHLIREFIEQEILFEKLSISNSQSLFDEGTIDSISFVALLQFLESKFNAKFLRSELYFENFDSIEKIARSVRNKNPAAGIN